jgi:prephenate dehydrogenase
MQSVAIVGVGLIGASFGLALREAGFAGELIGVSSQSAIDAGLRTGAISKSATLEDAAATADWIYLAQPVDRILQTIAALGAMVRRKCLITDAGSTKSAIVTSAKEHIQHATFVGGHPMAGKEQSGADAAEAGLFRGRPYILTPEPSLPTTEIVELRSWLTRIGANVFEMDAHEHDAVVAFTSHLPQLLSACLAAILAERNGAVAEVHGPGLLDMTRLACSSPELWQSIFSTNREQIANAVDCFVRKLLELRDVLGGENLVPLLRNGQLFAQEIRKTGPTVHKLT